MTFLFEFISLIVEEVNWRRRTALEQRIAFAATELLALSFVGAAVAAAILRVLTGRQAPSVDQSSVSGNR